VQIVMTSEVGAVDGVVAVESELKWLAEDTAAQVPPAELAPLG
jgi:hypothetical protein